MQPSFILKSVPIAIFIIITFKTTLSRDFHVSVGTDYLIRYGYLPKTSNGNKLISIDSALRSFQKRFGLNATGQFDQSTITLMSRRRCGISDGIEGISIQPRNGFQLYGTKWVKKRLTYDILSYTNQIGKKKVMTAHRSVSNHFK